MARRPDAPTDAPDPEGKKASLGQRLIGLFVESEEEQPTDPELPEATGTAEEIDAIAAGVATRRAPRAPTAPPKERPPVPARPAPPASYRRPDYDAVFKALGLSDDERDRLSKAESLLKTLPNGTPTEVQQQIVAGLRTFGIEPDRVSAAAAKAIDVIDTWKKRNEQELKSRIEATQKRLQELRAEEERLSTALSERQAVQFALVHDAADRQAQLRHVIDFFSLPAGRHEPD